MCVMFDRNVILHFTLTLHPDQIPFVFTFEIG